MYVVGIGPGAYDLLTLRADRVLKEVEEIVGYKTYIKLVKPHFPEKDFREFGMGEELKRISYAVDMVLKGKSVALISGGDPTIYGMVSPLIEYILEHNLNIDFEVIPGVTSMVAASSLIGAPLGNDFATISLSDYLVDWGEIVERLKTVLLTKMTVVLYNPVSREKEEKIRVVKDLIVKSRGKDTLLGIVTNAERDRQKCEVIPVLALSPNKVSMRSIIFVSGPNTVWKNGYLFTQRGYEMRKVSVK